MSIVEKIVGVAFVVVVVVAVIRVLTLLVMLHYNISIGSFKVVVKT